MKRAIRKKIFLVLWIGLFLGGCATSRDVQILDDEIYKLQAQVSQLQKEKDVMKRDLAASKTGFTAEAQRLQTDLSIRVENLQSEVRILRTGIEEYREFLRKPSKEIDRVREDFQVRLRILEERGKALDEKNKAQAEKVRELEEKNRGQMEKIRELEEHVKGLEGKMTAPPKQAEVEKTAETKGVMTGTGDLYKDAYETFQRGDLEAARKKFEAFLRQYPNTELSDNAQFWIGETYYLKKDFEKAILEYEKTIAKYPEGDKVPAAMFKQALAFLELGDRTNGRNLLKRLIERFPHSEQTDLAKKKLESIK